MKKNQTSKFAKVSAKILKSALTVEANSTTCTLVHQPKAPKALKKFSKIK